MNSSWRNILTNHQQTVTNNTACHKFGNKPPTNENILSLLGDGPLQGICRMSMTFCLSISCIELVINLQSICFTFVSLAFVRTKPEKSQKKIIHRLFNVCDFQFFYALLRHLFVICIKHVTFLSKTLLSNLFPPCSKPVTSLIQATIYLPALFSADFFVS